MPYKKSFIKKSYKKKYYKKQCYKKNYWSDYSYPMSTYSLDKRTQRGRTDFSKKISTKNKILIVQKLRVRVNENELRYADTVSIIWRLVKNLNRSIRQNNALWCAGIHNKNNWAGHATIFLLRWSPRRLFWCARTWPYPYNVWTYSIIKNR